MFISRKYINTIYIANAEVNVDLNALIVSIIYDIMHESLTDVYYRVTKK